LVFTILSGDDEFDRACEIIPDSLCTNLPLNYVMNVVNGAASKLAEQVASAKVVLPWLLSTMGAPAYIVGFLLPLRQAGTLLPQLVVSGQMRRFEFRKRFWVLSAIVQALMLMGMIVVAAGLAAAVSSPIWGRFADLSSRKVLVIGGMMGAVTGAAALFLGILPAFFQNPYVYGLIFVLLGFAEAGVLLGRKTFLIDQVDPDQRTTYVAFANTVMGVVTLLFGFAGILAQVYGIQILIFILTFFGIAGAVVSFFLPEISGKDDA
jgi:MFS family permease